MSDIAGLYRGIESTTPALGQIGSRMANVQNMYDAFLDFLSKKKDRQAAGMREITGRAMDFGLGQVAEERSLGRQVRLAKEQLPIQKELETHKENLFQSRYANPAYVETLNTALQDQQARLWLVQELNKPGNEALKKSFLDMLKAQQATSHTTFATGPEAQEAAERARMFSPSTYIGDMFSRWKATVTLPDGSIDESRYNAEDFKKTLLSWIQGDEQGGIFNRKPEAYRNMMDNLDSYISAYFRAAQPKGPVSAARKPSSWVGGKPGGEVVPFAELTEGRKLLEEVFAGMPLEAMGEKLAAQRALSAIKAAEESPEQETREQLREALEFLDNQLRAIQRSKRTPQEKEQERLYEEAQQYLLQGL